MALVKCSECGAAISKKADACPKCGAVRRQKTGCMSYLVGGVLLLVVIGWLADSVVSPDSGTRSAAPAQSAPKPQSKPVLALESFTCTKTDSGAYGLIRGRVQNLTDNPLDYVQVVGSFKTAGGGDLGSEQTYIDIRPLLPGQSSGFEIYGTTNPEYASCSVDAMLVSSRQVRWENRD